MYNRIFSIQGPYGPRMGPHGPQFFSWLLPPVLFLARGEMLSLNTFCLGQPRYIKGCPVQSGAVVQ